MKPDPEIINVPVDESGLPVPIQQKSFIQKMMEGIISEEEGRILLDRYMQIKRDILKRLVKLTSPKHWTLIEGTLWPRSGATSRIASGIGVSFTDVKRDIQEFKTPEGEIFYEISFSGYVSIPSLGLDPVYQIGTCSTRDIFFAFSKAGGWKDLSEIDIGNISKAAYTNFQTRAIMFILGLTATDLDDLEEMGFDKNQIQQIRFKGKKDSPKYNEKITPHESAKKKIAKMIVDYFGTNDREKCAGFYLLATGGLDWNKFDEIPEDKLEDTIKLVINKIDSEKKKKKEPEPKEKESPKENKPPEEKVSTEKEIESEDEKIISEVAFILRNIAENPDDDNELDEKFSELTNGLRWGEFIDLPIEEKRKIQKVFIKASKSTKS